MDATLIHGDDDSCREVDRLIGELSSELCLLGDSDLDALIASTIARIGDAAGADALTLIAYGDVDTPARTYRCERPPLGEKLEPADAADVSPLWDRLPLERDPLVLAIPADLPSAALTPDVLDYLRRVSVQSVVVVPVMIAADRTCLLAVESRAHRGWSRELVSRFRLFVEILAGRLHRHHDAVVHEEQSHFPEEEELHEAHEAARPRRVEGDRDDEAGRTRSTLSEIVGESFTLKDALRRMEEVVPTRSTVLLLGETGTGKELFARAIHVRGPRRSNPFVVVNCAALPPSLIESELFGHTRGAFTGAVTTRQGRFELAHRGTLFLDEIGDLPLDLQTKLLRVLQEGTFERLGSSQAQKVDVRIVAATHRDLRKMIQEGTFREDLYYRLSVFPIRLPSLRERPEDIPELVWSIIGKRQRLTQRRIKRVPPNVMEQLQRRQWPGNVRELENVIERALIHTTGDVLMLLEDNVEVSGPRPDEDGTTLSSIERAHIQEVLRACGWRINGTGNAAERLGLHPNTLRFRMKKLGIIREGPSRPGAHLASA
ncbi:MAG TPA: sigma 54-interacting transcriptional regulator [Vicinamibacterales bacterium]|nr:sigma 54-interacting transcriptional regulator [Vicinamibacterales bacterium]